MNQLCYNKFSSFKFILLPQDSNNRSNTLSKQWTEEQSFLVIEMWDSGFDESQIAGELGGDFTKNDVVNYIDGLDNSKLNRLTDFPFVTIEEVYEEVRKKKVAAKEARKLAKQKTATEPKSAPESELTPNKSKSASKSKAPSTTKPTPQPEKKAKPKTQPESKTKAKTKPTSQPDKSTKTESKSPPPKKKFTQPNQGAIKKLSITELTEFSCRWPFGDPQESDFYFCGRMVEVGEVYCLDHCLEAYQNYATRKEEREKAAQEQEQAQAKK